jgi:F0F1-type ATP synthase membrane subunit b/b'
METALFLPILSVLLVVVAAGLVFLALAYRQLVEHFERLQNQIDLEHAPSQQHANTVMSAARHHSQELLAQSEKKAQDILINAEFFTSASQKELGEKLEEATQKHLYEYEHMLASFRQDLGKTFHAMAKDLNKGAEEQLASFRESIQQQTKQAETEFQSQMSQNYQVAQKEITAYKEMMMKKIDQQTYEIVKEVVQTVAPNMVSNKDHEALVLHALTDAKQHHAI